jgi:hypothetical protein
MSDALHARWLLRNKVGAVARQLAAKGYRVTADHLLDPLVGGGSRTASCFEHAPWPRISSPRRCLR